METFTGVLGLAGLAAVGFTLHVCAVLSARLGAVARMRPWYRLFWVGIGSCDWLSLPAWSKTGMLLSRC
jgi:hypothetical protein